MRAGQKVLRCPACGKRIRDHHPDVEVREAATGRVRYFHQWCSAAAYAAARERGGVWLATYRHVEPHPN